MKTLAVVVISMVALALPTAAVAQGTSAGRGMARKDDPIVDHAKKRADDKAYSDSLSRIAPKEYDPWAGVREKPPEKPQAPQKKSGR